MYNKPNCPSKIYIIYSRIGKKRDNKVDTPIFVTFSCEKDKKQLLYYFKHGISTSDSTTHQAVKHEINKRGLSKAYLNLYKYNSVPVKSEKTRDMVKKIQKKLNSIIKYPT